MSTAVVRDPVKEETPVEAPVEAAVPEVDEDKAEPVEEAQEQEEAASGASNEGLETPVSPEDANRLGVKESVENADAMAIAKKDDEEAEKDAPVAPPSFFVDTEKRHRVEVDILCSKKDGSILSVSRTGLGIEYDDFTYLNHVREWFEFTMPTYEDMSTYRQRCGVYRADAQQVLIDRLQLRNFLLVWHLKDWSLRTTDGKKVELGHDDNGTLDAASMKKMYSVQSTILDVVVTILEKDILLT